MGEFLAQILPRIFGGNSILGTFLIALLPLLELKEAIPIGVSTEIWGDAALSTWQAFCWAWLGSCLVVPIVALIFRPIYEWMKTKKFFQVIVDFLVGDVAKRSDKIKAENQNQSSQRGWWLKILALFLFVAFPVPLTGVWTGTCFGVLLGLNFWTICATAIVGNTVCGVIITFLCQIFPQTDILLVIFLTLILCAVIVKVFLHVWKKRHKQPESGKKLS